MRHVPVLLEEVIESLKLNAGDTVIDCTVGDGGHSEEILKAISPEGRLLAIDADPESLLRAKKNLHEWEDQIIFQRGNFENLLKISNELGFKDVNGILMDFGWSSPQFEERKRGFSFQKDEPLDMRYGAGLDKKQTAKDIINNYSENELEKIFVDYGEEKNAKKIASVIVLARSSEEIVTTGQLVEVILDVFRDKFQMKKGMPWVGKIHPATKVFQALRIVANDELGVIEKVLPAAIDILAPKGRLSVITFHSLEDRIVKHYFKKHFETLKIITKKPILSSDMEVKNNPRARSAKLRVIEKI